MHQPHLRVQKVQRLQQVRQNDLGLHQTQRALSVQQSQRLGAQSEWLVNEADMRVLVSARKLKMVEQTAHERLARMQCPDCVDALVGREFAPGGQAVGLADFDRDVAVLAGRSVSIARVSM